MMEGDDASTSSSDRFPQPQQRPVPPLPSSSQPRVPIVIPTPSSTSSSSSPADHNNLKLEQTSVNLRRAFQYWLDKSTIHVFPRWIFFSVLLALFFLRVYLVQGYFIVAYGLGIFLLNNFIAFLSPLEEPNSMMMSSRRGGILNGYGHDDDDDGLSLPTTQQQNPKEEFRPFARRLPEFKFWFACTRGCLTCIGMTFFSIFDVPVFWPILLLYFFVLFFMTMKRQMMHMYKHKYVPISFGKAKYKDAGVEHGIYGGGMGKSK